MNLKNLKKILIEKGCKRVYLKILALLPISEIKTEEAGDWEKERFKAKLDFSWISGEGGIYPAPNAQLILYPKYPEVRFSGFLLKCENPPSDVMTKRLEGRLLFFSVTNPDSEIAKEVSALGLLEEHGIFKLLELETSINSKEKLLNELSRINRLGWIKSKRLDSIGNFVTCEAPNCGGYTLEAELGIKPNGFSEPDYLGWEVKQFGVANFAKIESAIITLMTPEPTNGIYKTKGAEYFLNQYGYKDKTGKEDRINFGGVHKVNVRHHLTNLEMQIFGFDNASGKIRNANGRIALIDRKGVETASWDFASLLLHWNRKHNKACYVPSKSETTAERKYSYGNRMDFQLFLGQMACGNIYYDPGIKMENVSAKPKIKKRSQFRIKSQYLTNLYKENEVVDI